MVQLEYKVNLYQIQNWGPKNRATFTVDKPASYNSFNSIIDNPNHGDERDYVHLKFVGENASSWRKDLHVKSGDNLIIRAYFHNNGAANINLIAEKVLVKTFLHKENSGTRLFIQLESQNSNPEVIWDSVFLSHNDELTINLKEGSVRLYTNVRPSDGFLISESIASDLGAWIGYDKIDGKIPGCFQFSSILTFKLNICS